MLQNSYDLVLFSIFVVATLSVLEQIPLYCQDNEHI